MREAGQYLWDLRVGGADTNVYNFKKAGNMAPIRPRISEFLLASREATARFFSWIFWGIADGWYCRSRAPSRR